MRLVTAVVFSSETPVNIGENRLIVEINCSEDAAAYARYLLGASHK